MNLYSLPKDILVKLVCEIQEQTRKELLDSLFEEEYEKKCSLINKFLEPKIFEKAKQIVKSLIYQNVYFSFSQELNKPFRLHLDLTDEPDINKPYIAVTEYNITLYYGVKFHENEIQETDIEIFLEKIKDLKKNDKGNNLNLISNDSYCYYIRL